MLFIDLLQGPEAVETMYRILILLGMPIVVTDFFAFCLPIFLRPNVSRDQMSFFAALKDKMWNCDFFQSSIIDDCGQKTKFTNLLFFFLSFLCHS